MRIPTTAAILACDADDDVTFLARLLFGEARGETWEGKVAVAHVVKNRSQSRGRWPSSIKSVGLQPFQFSCFGDGGHLAAVLDPPKADPIAWGACLAVASDVLCGRAADPTGIAPNHYITEALFQSKDCPPWAKNAAAPQKVLGHHRFLRL